MRSSWGEEISALKLFNEKAEKLHGLSFRSKVFQKLSVGIDSDGQLIRQLPDSESTDAAILTLRLFLQDNEPSSLRNIAKIYARVPLPLGVARISALFGLRSMMIWKRERSSRQSMSPL